MSNDAHDGAAPLEPFDRLNSLLRAKFQLDRGDLDFGLYRIMAMKAGEIEEFLDRAVGPDAFLFPRHAEGRGAHSLAACWRAVCTDAKLGSLRLHDLRHTAASQAVMSGEGLPLVGRLLGHNRYRTTAGYAHLADAHLVKAAEKVGAIIATATASQRPRPITHRQ